MRTGHSVYDAKGMANVKARRCALFQNVENLAHRDILGAGPLCREVQKVDERVVNALIQRSRRASAQGASRGGQSVASS
ncbi:hypothetical protein BURKHO8Y_110035 [Burkholderia sp. 8Y]|nr:hypothetical protein BURKHO8Y_110035 [Burkholderia sp. 8Y]